MLMNRKDTGVCLILVFILGIVSVYFWSSIFNQPLEVETCPPNVNISVHSCRIAENSTPNRIVQECEFKNTSKYTLQVGYKPGKYYQKYWYYDSDGVALNKGELVGNFPQVLRSGASTKGHLTYYPDAEKIILCPLDPASFEGKEIFSLL